VSVRVRVRVWCVRARVRCEVSDRQREIRRIVVHHALCMCVCVCVCAYGTCMVQPVS
jgi:hypothetical protein